MQRKVSVHILSDPFTSPKPVEGLRIATGLTESGISVSVICPETIRSLLQNTAQLVDGAVLEGIIELVNELPFAESGDDADINLYF